MQPRSSKRQRGYAIRAFRLAALGLLLTALTFNHGVLAASPVFDEGVKLYQGHQYKLALGKFSAVARTAPQNALVRYYMGLCYQGMNQVALAKQQYQYAASIGPDSLTRRQASVALAGLSRYGVGSAGSAAIGGSGATVGASNTTAIATMPAGSAMGATGKPHITGRLKIIEFYADW